MINKPKVVIVGGGFGGIHLAKALKKAPIELLLIDKKNHHLFQPLLYQVATAAISPGDIAAPLREILSDQKNASVIMGEVLSIDKKNKTLTLEDGETIFYDYLVLAVGATHSYFGHDTWSEFAPGLKTVEDALSIREQILLSFEKAERSQNPKEEETALNFIIIGGGPTGVEMAGAIAEIAYRTLFKNFRKINPKKSQIYLIEGADRILPSYPKNLSQRAQKDLEHLGVKVCTNTTVKKITQEGAYTEKGLIPSQNIIWAAGTKASPLLETLKVPLDRQGRATVEKDLSIKGHPEIFVIGDAASFQEGQKILPAVAAVAIQQGKYLGRLFKKLHKRESIPPFRYKDKGSLATIGKAKAVGFIGKIHLKGLFAWLIWGVIHIAYLIGFKNRFSVMLQWCFHYVGGTRGVRLIQRSISSFKEKK